MPTKVIQAKSRMPSTLQYNSWVAMAFESATLTASETSTAVVARFPLGLNTKITHISYVVSGTPAGNLALNIVSNSGSYEGAGAASSKVTLTLGGTYVAGDTITYVIGGVSTTFMVTSRNAGNLQLTAASIASAFNRISPLNVTYRASSLGRVVVFQTLLYGTTTPTFTASKVSTSGTVATSGGTFTAGVAGANPAAPVGDSTKIGLVPSPTAAPLTALFPCNIEIPLVGESEVTGTIYAVENFDAIFPSVSELTLRLVTDGSGAGTIKVVMYGVPVDNHPQQPAEAASYFHLNQTIL